MRESEYTEFARDDLIEFKELKYDSASTGDANLCCVELSPGDANGSSSSEMLTGKISSGFRALESFFVVDQLRRFFENPVSMLWPVIIDWQMRLV